MNCYVLAGGRSRRLGRSKPELFLDRVTTAARPAFDDVIIVEKECGSSLPPPIAAACRRIFESPHENEAPIFGIERALEHANADCFILAVDYPLITTEVLRFLRPRSAVPIWRAKPQPLCAAWPIAILPLVRSRIAAGRLDLRSLIEEAGTAIIAESELRARFEGEPLLNVNTPEDLEEAKAIDERLLASR
jgi:molybdopterin-guanine dinucleotide biosynthesis protein A